MKSILLILGLLDIFAAPVASAEATCRYLQPAKPIPDTSNLPPGAGSATFNLEFNVEGGTSGLPTPLGRVDAFVPSRNLVLNSIDVVREDFPANGKNSYYLHYFYAKSYQSVQFRVCSYLPGPRLKFDSLSRTFPQNVPYNYLGTGKVSVLPVQADPDLSGRATIRINLASTPVSRTSLSGLNLGLNDRPVPAFLPEFLDRMAADGDLSNSGRAASPEFIAALVKPLKLGLWRTGTQQPNTDRGYLNQNALVYAHETGAPICGLYFGAWPNQIDKKNGTFEWEDTALGGPYQHLADWTDYVTKSFGPGNSFIMTTDSWNEPEIASEAWPKSATPLQLFQTFVAGVKGLKATGLSSIKVGGPGFNRYDRPYFEAFLDYVVQYNREHPGQPKIEVNVLNWHELGTTEDDLSQIQVHLEDARQNILPKYPSLNIQEIHVNETLSASQKLFPGEQVGTLFYLEQGRADRAARDGWNDPKYRQDDLPYDGSVNGLFIPPNEHHKNPATWYQPRNTYWVARTYADVLDQRIPCDSGNKNIRCFAGAVDPDGEAKVLIGYFGTVHAFPAADVRLEFSGVPRELVSGGSVHVKLERIPHDNGERPWPSLPIIWENDVAVSGGKFVVTFPRLAVHEGAVVTLSVVRPSGGASSSVSVWDGYNAVTRCGNIPKRNRRGFWPQPGSPGCFTGYIGRANKHPKCKVDSFPWTDGNTYEERWGCGVPTEAGFYPNGTKAGYLLYQKAIAP